MSRTIKRFRLSLAMATLAALALSSSAAACSCAGLPGKEIFRLSDGAIVAKLLRVEPVGDGFNADYVFRVIDALKKRDRFEAGQIRRVRSSTESAACGIAMPIGKVTGLYLTRERDGHLSSNLCSVTTPARIRRTAKNVAAEDSGKRLTSTAAAGCSAAAA